MHGSYQAERDLLVQQNLDSNQVYAQKLAQSTSHFLRNLQHQVAYSASLIEENLSDPVALHTEAQRLREQNLSFNSVIVTNHNALAMATSPANLGLTGELIYSEGARQALLFKSPLVSEPYVSDTGRLLFFVSHPLFDDNSKYQGFIGGSIYLKAENSLNALLGEHFYLNGSEVFVIDQSQRIIYHHDRDRIGEFLDSESPEVELSLGTTGAQQLLTTSGESMLVGYATIEQTEWKIIAQRPTEVALTELKNLQRKALLSALPFLALLILALWYLSRLITAPLHLLAKTAPQWDSPDITHRINGIQSWYFEAAEIKKGMLIGLRLLNEKLDVFNQERLTDPLTGLRNRRSMQKTAAAWMAQERPFTLITCDIDNFKLVNDHFGHQMGDNVLVFVAQRLQDLSRQSDEVCRIGGEEFLLMLPNTSLAVGEQIAERLRADIANTLSPIGQAITISIGVSRWNTTQQSFDDALSTADKALYRAKSLGGNRVESSDTTPIES